MRVPKVEPSRLAKVTRQLKQYETLLGFERYPDPNVDQFMKLMNPIRKRMIESDIMRSQHRLLKSGESNSSANGVACKQARVKNQKNMVDAVESFGMKNDKSTVMIPTSLFIRQESEILEQYREFISNNSIILFVEDLGDSITDINYENKVETPIRQLNSEGIVFKNVDAQLFQNLLKESILQKRMKIITPPKSFKDLGLSPMFKAIFIPQTSVDFAAPIIEILQKEQNHYKLFTVFINIERSPEIAKELNEVLKGYGDRSASSSYQALLNKAIESHSTTNVTTRKLLTTIGESGLLKVITGDKSISFIQHLDGEIDGK